MGFAWHLHRRRHSAKGVSQIDPVSGFNFSNNISISQVRINIREGEHGTTFEISSLLTFRINPRIVKNGRGLIFKWKFTVFILLENVFIMKPLPHLDLIWSLVLPFRITSHKFFPKKACPLWKHLFRKYSPVL